MRALLAIALTTFWASFAHAEDGRLITESDTGVVFGDVDCHIQTSLVKSLWFSVDEFDYVNGTVTFETTCVSRDGNRHTSVGQDTVLFPTLEFDWATQAWYFGDVKIADRDASGDIQMNNSLTYKIWADTQESHVSFRVEVRETPPTP